MHYYYSNSGIKYSSDSRKNRLIKVPAIIRGRPRWNVHPLFTDGPGRIFGTTCARISSFFGFAGAYDSAAFEFTAFPGEWRSSRVPCRGERRVRRRLLADVDVGVVCTILDFEIGF